jgi:integrase
MNYSKKEGKHGPIYQVAEGISVTPNEWGSWLLILRRGSERKKKAFGKTEEDLNRALKAAELLAARLGLALERQGDRSFGQVAKEWLEINDARWRPGTRERYQSVVRDFLRPLAPLPLDKVDRARVKRLLAELLQIRSPGTVEMVHAVLSGIFSEAIDLGYTDRNPAYGLLKRILPPKKSRALTEPDPFSQEDLGKFLAASWEKLPEPLALVLEVMAMTGLRLGEALALAMRREYLEPSNGQYHVTATTRNGRYGPPKSGKRLVDLDDTLVVKLESHIQRLRKQSLAKGGQIDYLFPGITQRKVQRAVERVCAAARLRRRTPHDLRHTYATILLMDHYSPAYVQKQLGHHSISMTVDIYGHWLPGEGKKDLALTLRGEKNRPPARPLKAVT